MFPLITHTIPWLMSAYDFSTAALSLKFFHKSIGAVSNSCDSIHRGLCLFGFGFAQNFLTCVLWVLFFCCFVLFLHIYVCRYLCVCVCVFLCMFVFFCVCVRVYMCMCVHFQLSNVSEAGSHGDVPKSWWMTTKTCQRRRKPEMADTAVLKSVHKSIKNIFLNVIVAVFCMILLMWTQFKMLLFDMVQNYCTLLC